MTDWRNNLSISDLKWQLQQNILHLVDRYCPGGFIDGDLYWARNPARADNNIGSFNVRVRGSGNHQVGMFHDFAAPEYSGDIIDFFTVFVCGAMPGSKQRGEAIREAKNYLGIPVTQRLAPAIPTGTNSYSRSGDNGDLHDKQKRARDRWIGRAKPIQAGDPVWRYLIETRKIPVNQFDKPPGAIRFLEQARHAETDTHWPAMLSAMVNAKGKIIALHTTFLTPDGQKAPVSPVKKMWPSMKGASVPLAKGKSGLSAGKAREQGLCDDRVVFTEGIEDALSWRVMCPDDRVHAVGSIGNFGNLPIFHCADTILIVRDRFKADQDKRDFLRQLDKIKRRIDQALKIRGYCPRLIVQNSEPYDDVNDMWRASLREAERDIAGGNAA